MPALNLLLRSIGLWYDGGKLQRHAAMTASAGYPNLPESDTMPILNLEEVKPGMTLAKAVHTHPERPLLEAGRRLTEKHLRIFKSWGVATVEVKESAAGEGASLAAAAPAEPPDDRLREKFSNVLGDPVMREIMEAAARQTADRERRRKARHGGG